MTNPQNPFLTAAEIQQTSRGQLKAQEERTRNIHRLKPVRELINNITDLCDMDVEMSSLRGNKWLHIDLRVEDHAYKIGASEQGGYEIRLNEKPVTDKNPPEYLFPSQKAESVADAIGHIFIHAYPEKAEAINSVIDRFRHEFPLSATPSQSPEPK